MKQINFWMECFHFCRSKDLIQKILSIIFSKGALLFAINLMFLSQYCAVRTGKITETIFQLLILNNFLGALNLFLIWIS